MITEHIFLKIKEFRRNIKFFKECRFVDILSKTFDLLKIPNKTLCLKNLIFQAN
ncbi:hypothetical protein D3OALGA1CA_477 [Olavius algarvensis associated proteobacterium Delta 3]|nr:hypothetical protein D3OALGB2SA_461 [Olavius algarvensis associated proteobacterium Delta 3]CAB5084667.1 hypothetical protein D3OALGA1CA_477 [Olavius algarvensis associated proteobacterium Delta 3]